MYDCVSDVAFNKILSICFSVAERPQHMLMRVAVGIHENDIEGAIEVGNIGRKILSVHFLKYIWKFPKNQG